MHLTYFVISKVDVKEGHFKEFFSGFSQPSREIAYEDIEGVAFTVATDLSREDVSSELKVPKGQITVVQHRRVIDPVIYAIEDEQFLEAQSALARAEWTWYCAPFADQGTPHGPRRRRTGLPPLT